MDSADRLRAVLSHLAQQDALFSIDLHAEPGTEGAFTVPGLSADEIHRSFSDAAADGLMDGESIEGDGSLRMWNNPRLTVRGLGWLGMWPNRERPVRDRRWWDRALHVLRTLHENPPDGAVLFAPLGTNGPSSHLPGADERTYWMVVRSLREAGLIRGRLMPEGVSHVAVTPEGEAALTGGRSSANPTLGALSEGPHALLMQVSEINADLPHHERQFHIGDDEYDGRSYIKAGDHRIPALWNDVSKLEQAGLVEWTEQNYLYGNKFVLTTRGEATYREALRDSADRLTAIEEDVTSYLRGSPIASRYPQTYKRWLRAEQQLISGKSEDLTVVGHTAREALQLFGSELISLHRPPDAPADPTKTVARLRAVLEQHKIALGETRAALLDALLAYWGTVNDLAQRLEHAAQKEGESISREDARQLVYLTAQVIFEVDRTLPTTTTE